MTDLVYIVSRWGEPTQTFVRREAEAVQGRGVSVRALSLKPLGVATSSVSALYLGPLRVVFGFIAAFGRRPLRVAGGIALLVRGSQRRNVPRQLVAFAVGGAWAATGRVDGASLHAHFGWVAATACWSAARLTGGSFSVVLHAFELHDPRYSDDFTVTVLRRADAVFTISERDRAIVEKRWGIRARVLRMGVSGPWLSTARSVVDQGLVVSVGSLVSKKGHDVLIQAMAQLPTWRARIVGDGPLRSELQGLIDGLGLGERVELVGSKDEVSVRALVAEAQVFALACVDTPSGDRDGIPVALMEAMALGVPVVSTRVGAIPELVEGAGVLVEPGSPEALAAAIESLDDQEENRLHGWACWARIREGWTSAAAADVVAHTHAGPSG